MQVPDGTTLVITEESNGSTLIVIGFHGAGIGGGWEGGGGEITIEGGRVEARSFTGAGIGGGYSGEGGTITISGGSVEASSSRAAAGTVQTARLPRTATRLL